MTAMTGTPLSLDIMIAPQAGMTEEIWDTSLVVAESLKWPPTGYQQIEKEKMVKQHVASFKIDREKFGNGPLTMHVVLKVYGGPWKSGWTWEAVSIEFPNFAYVPPLERKQ